LGLHKNRQALKEACRFLLIHDYLLQQIIDIFLQNIDMFFWALTDFPEKYIIKEPFQIDF